MYNSEFSNVELVTIAVALLNGDKAYVDREDVALKVNDIAPGRFLIGCCNRISRHECTTLNSQMWNSSP